MAAGLDELGTNAGQGKRRRARPLPAKARPPSAHLERFSLVASGAFVNWAFAGRPSVWGRHELASQRSAMTRRPVLRVFWAFQPGRF